MLAEENAAKEKGIRLKHRDGFYPEKVFFFEEEKTTTEWLKVFSDFKESSIFDEYVKL